MEINIGMTGEQRSEIADRLSHLLADSYSLYLKTHNYHWNVEGPQFNTLHAMFETQYSELALAVDEIAERIRALGVKAPGSYTEFSKLTSIADAKGGENADDMVRLLVEGQETAARTARGAFRVAEAANDQPTADLLTQRMQVHEKNAWMLRDAGIEFDTLELNSEFSERTLRAVTGRTTVPQVFVNGALIGGADELESWLSTDQHKAA